MLRRLAVLGLAVSAVTLFSARPAQAGSAGTNLGVQATVLGYCTIAAGQLFDYGNYDPSAALPLDVSNQVAIQCTQGTNYWLGLGNGANFAAPNRRMAGGTGEFLNYQFYTDAPGGTVWDNLNGPAANANTVAAGLSPYNITIFGRVPAGQVVSAGVYTDTVVMTVNF